MAIVLSRRIKQNTKKRVLVCGDSYFYDQRQTWPGLHWTQKMPNHIEITNVAWPGSSNAMILHQFIDNYQGHDAVILGFTGPFRIEFQPQPDIDMSYYDAKYITSNYPSRLTDRHRKFIDEYRSLVSIDMEFYRCAALMSSILDLARSTCIKVVYSLNAGKFLVEFMSRKNKKINYYRDLLNNDLPFNLDEYYESNEYRVFREQANRDPIAHPSFHVHHDHIQLKFAHDVIERLGF